jgi:NitT/TauT family transport system substrate-binding protein
MEGSHKVQRGFAAVLLVATLSLAPGAQADTKIRVGQTPAASLVASYIAQEKGFFAQRGLDVELQVITLNSNIPAALMAGATDIGGTTTTVLLQAVDSGIDLVAVSGTNVTFKESTNSAIIARTGSGIVTPADFVGKKIGVPGLGALIHVSLRNWLSQRGVDYKSVNFVELSFPQQRDALQSGLVDAVVTVEPTYSRILAAGLGKDIGHAFDSLPPGTQTILYSTTRQWASEHQDAVRAFYEANEEGTRYALAHLDEARAAIAKYLKLPPDAANAVEMPRLNAAVTVKDLAVIADIMTQQQMLHSSIDAEKLLFR